MLLAGTLVVLALWLGFVFIVDPDGFRKRRGAHARRSQSPRSHF